MECYQTPGDEFQIESVPVSNGLARIELSAQARGYARDARALNTRRAYLGDLKRFNRWCSQRGLCPLPASGVDVANYMSCLAHSGRKPSTIDRALAAISETHRLAGLPSPRSDHVVRDVMKGIRRTLSVAQNRKAPVMLHDLKRMVTGLPEGLKGIRDRALLVLGFAGAFRRSELVALDVGDLSFTTDGLEVRLRGSKTDQERAGVTIGVPYGGHPKSCPVRAVQAWLGAAAIVDGPVFRRVDRHGRISPSRLGSKAVAGVVKACAELTGLDPGIYGGHSLRSGLITTAIKVGKSEHLVMRQSRHKSIAVFRTYVRDVDLFSENAAAGIGL